MGKKHTTNADDATHIRDDNPSLSLSQNQHPQQSEEFSFTNKLNLSDLYDKNLNFLIGSGASFGLFPTLQLNIKGNDNSSQTIETLATHFEDQGNANNSALLFMHYYKTCIEPVLQFDLKTAKSETRKQVVLGNYEKFIKTILLMLRKKKNGDLKLCNIFTTNYDACIAYAADEILQSGIEDFILNDGTRGFFLRHLSAKNFNTHVKHSGVFDRYSRQLAQINLIHIHGSAYWKKNSDHIQVDYNSAQSLVIDVNLIPDISKFSAALNNSEMRIADIPEYSLDKIQREAFLDAYKKLPIVNPTKWKFHETVFREHYYQMLRHLSYELEKPSTVLITFGFSFADEHILTLIQRSLGNPHLQVFVSCFNQTERDSLSKKFERYNNITFLLGSDANLDFSNFNNEIFTLKDLAK